MNHIKGSEHIFNNVDIDINNSANEANQISVEEGKGKINLDKDHEIIVSDGKNNQKDTEEANLERNNTKDNVFVVMAYRGTNQRSDGQMNEPQHIYYGGQNTFQQPPPYQQAPPVEEPEHRETEAPDNVIIYTPERRNKFIRRIMIIVFIMLLMTAAFIAVVLSVPSVEYIFDMYRIPILIPTIILILIVNYAMTCLSPCTRYAPCNIVFLTLSVVGLSLFCGVITSYFDTQIVLYAFVATTAVVIMCIILACTSFDFTSYLLFVIVLVTTFSVLCVLVLAGLALAQIDLRPTFLGFLVITTLFQVIIFTIHLQTIIGGKRVVLREEDYALGAYMLYMSIIDIFVRMVLIFGISSDM